MNYYKHNGNIIRIDLSDKKDDAFLFDYYKWDQWDKEFKIQDILPTTVGKIKRLFVKIPNKEVIKMRLRGEL